MRFSYLLILFVSHVSFAQADMTLGYKMLENGQLEEAIDFFNEVVINYPNDKTANICLGRAVGLSGDPVKALQIFAQADKLYPDDFELNLNIAEAYLWNKLPAESLQVYQRLLTKDVNNYTANLGMANCHYELGEFVTALYYINAAISILPQNQNTYQSKKYILLAIASEKTKNFQYQSAIEQLNLILDFMPLDGHALLNKGINYIKLEDYKSAKHCFKTLLEKDLELVDGNILMSHLSMLQHNNKNAISHAKDAVKAALDVGEDELLRASVQQLNALGAAKKFKIAEELLNEFIEKYGSIKVLLMAAARLKVWNREPILGLEIYDELELNYDVCMGKAEAFVVLNKTRQALEYLEKALAFNPHSDDVLRLQSELLDSKKIVIELGVNGSSDDGSNQGQELNFNVVKPLGDKHQLHFSTGYRQAKNQFSSVQADQVHIFIGDRFHLNQDWTMNAALGMVSSETLDGNRSMNTTAMAALKYQLAKDHSLLISYNRESLKYSSDLIKSGIVNNKTSATYQFDKPKLPGLSAQYSRAYYNDGNSNYQLFASLYYELSSFPLIKLGLNASHLSYDQQKPWEYFSPDVYQMAEVFIHFGNNYEKKTKFSYSILMAIGKQQIANNELETAQRIDLELGYTFKSGVSLKVNYFTNSAATANLKAYSFQKLGLRAIKRL